MVGTHDLWAFQAASFLLWLTPGPDTMYILSRSIAQGRRAGVMSALGIGSGLLIHTLLAAFGLSALLAASAWAFAAVKTAGALYLIFLGVIFVVGGTLWSLGQAVCAASATQAPARLITTRPHFGIQAPAGELRAAGPKGWWALAAHDPDRQSSREWSQENRLVSRWPVMLVLGSARNPCLLVANA